MCCGWNSAALLVFLLYRQRRASLLPVSRKDLKMNASDKGVNLSGWEVDPKEIRILTRPDGSDWELGEGNFGRVVKGTRDGVQVRLLRLCVFLFFLLLGRYKHPWCKPVLWCCDSRTANGLLE